MPASSVQETLALAVRYHQAGRWAEAEALYRQILAAQPNHPDALHLLGVVALQSGRHEVAVDWLRRAIAIKPGFAPPHYHLGNALREQRKFDEATAEYRRAVELKPDYAEAHANLGLALNESGRLEEAIAAHRRALELKPDQAELHNNLAGALKDHGQFGEAIAAYQHALALQPKFAAAHFNLGNLLREQGRLDEAIACYRRAVELTPDHAEGHHNLGVLLEERGQLDEAIAAYQQALALNPAEGHNNLGITFTLRGQLNAAVEAFHRAIDLQPNHAEAYNNLGVALRELGQVDAAIETHRRAIQLKPDLTGAYNNLGVALKDRGDLEEALAVFRQALAIDPQLPAVHNNLIFALYYQPGQNRSAIAAEQARWNARFCAPLRHFAQPHTNPRDPARRLKIGYVSASFCDDAVGANLRPLLTHHDHREFEIFCYSGVLRADPLTAEFRRHADAWRNTVGLGDEALATMIRADDVDILVDLSQHISGTRLPVFARQPAPVQVSFLGYPDTAGVEAIPYRISGRWLEDEGEPRAKSQEPSGAGAADSAPLGSRNLALGSLGLFLLDSFWCYDPQGIDIAVNELPAHASGQVTFGSLNNFCKFNEPVWKLWAQVLGKVRDSRLVIQSAEGTQRQRVAEIFEGEGISAERLEFFTRRPRRAYLELYHRIDIALDPFPYNGHTTTLEALWMGVPVVTLAGESPVSRGALSILRNLGLPELVATTGNDYLRIATELAHDLPRLSHLRATLRSRMESSVLMDAPHFARQIEAAYRAMWREWCQRNERTTD